MVSQGKEHGGGVADFCVWCVLAYTAECMCPCMQKHAEEDTECFPLLLSTVIFETASLTEPEAPSTVRLAGQ